MVKATGKQSKNNITIQQLKISCRHYEELIAADVTNNYAIRLLELFCDTHAALQNGYSVTPHHVDKVRWEQWSVKARKFKEDNPIAKPFDNFVVEHGTPRRAFAGMVFKLWKEGNLVESELASLVTRRWKLAVLTKEENSELNKKSRSKVFDSPDKRWADAGIKF